MAQELDDSVLQILKDIRATLAEHSRFHEERRQAFSELRDDMRSANQNAVYAMGLATMSQRDGEATKARVAALETRVQRLEERFDRA